MEVRNKKTRTRRDAKSWRSNFGRKDEDVRVGKEKKGRRRKTKRKIRDGNEDG